MNLRPSGYEPDELPDCSTPHQEGRAFYKRMLRAAIAKVAPADGDPRGAPPVSPCGAPQRASCAAALAPLLCCSGD